MTGTTPSEGAGSEVTGTGGAPSGTAAPGGTPLPQGTADGTAASGRQLTDALEILGQSLSDQAFWIGFGLVLLFALSRFAVTGERADEADPPLVARSFTTRFRYYLSATAYIACYEFLHLALVGFGSFPEFQALLKQVIGSLTVEIEEGQTAPIGSPAWAALVTSSLLPAVPGFRVVDQRVRDFLHRFASIPTKAHTLADELLRALAQQQAEMPVDDLAAQYPGLDHDDRLLIGQLRWLQHAVEVLQDGTRNPRRAYDYGKFFSTWREPFRRATAREKTFLEAASLAKEPNPLVTKELRGMVNHLARFLACALLQIEPSEQDVRITAQRQLGLSALPRLEFAFSLKQIVLGGILIALVTFAAGLLSLFVVLTLQDRPVPIAGPEIAFIASWVPYAVLMLLPPFILAAGLQLYFADRWQNDGGTAPWEDRFLALSGLTAAAFGIGLLPPLAGTALGSGLRGTGWIFEIVPFALAPAGLAFTFFFQANWRGTGRRSTNFVLDFLVFGVVTGLVILLATWIATGHPGDLNFRTASNSAAFENDTAMWVLSITAGVLGGLLGAVQCLISRRLPPKPAVEPGHEKGEAQAAKAS